MSSVVKPGNALTRKGFRFRVYPTQKQEARLIEWSNALRFLWNLANEQRLLGLARCEDDKHYYTAFDQARELTELRTEHLWLEDVPRNASDHLLADLDDAWQRYFNKVSRIPRWKLKGVDMLSVTEPNPKSWHVDGATLCFPKIGDMPIVVHRPLEGKPKTCTLKRDGDQWFASICCEIEVKSPALRTEPRVAIDRGVALVVADSDGKKVPNPAHLEHALKRLARAQRTVSRRKKGSKNREKAKLKVARLHRTVRRQREHFLHGLSHDYAKSHGTVVVEDLQIENMVRSASGTMKRPGRNVAVKSGMNRRIGGAGWGFLVKTLKYKLAWSGGTLVEVPAAYSSQTCSGCGHVAKESRRSQAEFCCVSCGMEEHADVNAAKVLLTRANRPGQPVEGSSKSDARKSRKVNSRAPRRVTKKPALAASEGLFTG